MNARWLTAMGIFALLASVPLGAASGCGAAAGAHSQREPLSFDVLVEGSYSEISTDEEIVVRDQAGWTAFYKRHAPQATPPRVDFGRQMVVGVVLQRNTGGYMLRLTEVRETPDRLVVVYTETRPNPHVVTIQVLTQPYFLATIDRNDKPVAFEHRLETAPKP